MFSIENLAWRTGSRDGYRVQDLPVCERGPNGGRVMWFAPYDLKFDESSTPTFKDNDFIGRPEPVYTYTNTKRTGTLSWKIIVDHPSVVNLLVNRVLANEGDRERVDSIINSFYAGCKKYDLYELARIYNTIPTSELYTYQQILNDPNVTSEDVKNISLNTNNNVQTVTQPVTSPNGGVAGGNVIDSGSVNLQTYENLGLYFENDFPDPKTRQLTSSSPFQNLIGPYLTQKSIYSVATETNPTQQQQVTSFFDDVISDNWEQSKNFLKDIVNTVVNKGQRVTITLQGSASSPQTQVYNKDLSTRRVDSVLQYFNTFTFQSGEQTISLKNLISEGKVVIKSTTYGESATNVQPRSYKNNTTYNSYNCTDSDLTDGSNLLVSVYSVNAMSCRVVRIEKVVTQPLSTVPADTTANQNVALQAEGKQPQPQKPQPQIDLLQQVKQGISKKILRYLLSECDYFEVLKETNPFVFDSIKDKIKYFSPAFHSTTPEGLNSRLTFLQQCTRPGDTIPTVGPNGEKVYNDAINTAFGAPPVLVLRIGDFFNTKIIPTGLSIKYENLDINPEGIGVQPMIAEVNMNFNFVGGQGLQNPVERLQNALSFNFYANTEIYDERATPTVDTSTLDKQLVQAIIDQTPLVGVNDTTSVNQNQFGKTIGDITTRTQTETAETGTTSYTVFMDKIRTQSNDYYNTTYSFMNEVITEYNYGVYQATVSNMNYTDGQMLKFTSNVNSPLYGKPAEYQKNIDEVFGLLISDIETDKIPFIVEGDAGKSKNTTSVRTFKKNYVTYVNNLRGNFQSKLTERVQNLTNVQQQLGYTIDCSNLVNSGTDAYLMTDGTPKIFNVSGTTIQTGSTPALTANTFDIMTENLNILATLNQNFITDISKGNQFYNVTYKSGGDFAPLSTTNDQDMNTIEKKREYMIMCQTILKNYQDFRTKMLQNIDDTNFEKNFDLFYGTLTKDAFKRQQDVAISQLAKLGADYGKNYGIGVTFEPYPANVRRPFIFSTLPTTTSTQKTNVQNLYTTVNVDNNSKVYNLKKKFN
jgi:outer membrane protein OmpA-like peptidoglycan-associated protein